MPGIVSRTKSPRTDPYLSSFSSRPGKLIVPCPCLVRQSARRRPCRCDNVDAIERALLQQIDRVPCVPRHVAVDGAAVGLKDAPTKRQSSYRRPPVRCRSPDCGQADPSLVASRMSFQLLRRGRRLPSGCAGRRREWQGICRPSVRRPRTPPVSIATINSGAPFVSVRILSGCTEGRRQDADSHGQGRASCARVACASAARMAATCT